MKNTNTPAPECETILRRMDLFVDQQLGSNEKNELQRHIELCPDCSAEITRRLRCRARLREAARSASAPSAYLRTRVLAGVREKAEKQNRGWHGWQRQLTGAAAMLVMVLAGGSVAYQLGYLRFSAESQERYVGMLSQKVSSVMAVGLGNHLHCTVFGRVPKQVPKLGQVVNELPPEYKPLLKEVASRVPTGYQIFTAHACRYHRRPFYHIAMKKGDRLISLIVTKRQPGEAFGPGDVVGALSSSGIAVHTAGAQRFSVAAFETARHLAYVVADVPAGETQSVMRALGPSVSSFLASLEG